MYGVLDVKTGESLLFLPRYGVEYAVWCGPPPPADHYKTLYGFDHVHFVDEIANVLKGRGIRVLHTLYGKNTDSGKFSKEAAFEGMTKDFTVDNKHLHLEITECRVIKSAAEIEALRYIARVSSEAHIEVMKRARPGMNEYQLESIFRHHTQMVGGSRYLAYTCICGSGKNGAVLHYGHAAAPNAKEVKDGDMLLLDMGAEYQGYCADITCSYPASGKFTEIQKMVYNAVLAAVRAVEGAIKPGVLWSDCHFLAERTVLEHLVRASVVVLHGKTVADMQAIDLGAVFFPHGPDTSLGSTRTTSAATLRAWSASTGPA